MASPGNQQSAWQRLATHPFITLSGWVVGILGFITGIYFYSASLQYPALTWAISPSKAVLVKSGSTSKIEALYDGKPIKSDITAVQIAIWNAGKKPIHDSDILQPIVISTSDRTPILEASLRRFSRDVIRLRVNRTGLKSSEVGINWRVLEQNDYGVLQIIYAGNPALSLQMSGVVEGQSELSLTKESAISAYQETRKKLGTLPVLWAIALILLIANIRNNGPIGQWRTADKILFGSMIVTTALISALVYILYIAPAPGPPLGF